MNHHRLHLRSGLASLLLLAIVGCGIEGSLVGGRCADGLEPSGHTCVQTHPILITPDDPARADAAPRPDAGVSVPLDGSASDAASPVTTVSDPVQSTDPVVSVVDAAPPSLACAGPFVACHGSCIAVGSDGTNCGACGKVCPSNICVAGTCLGATPGDVVLIGHDFAGAAAGSAEAKVLVNALSIPTTDPIRVLSFEDGAPAAAVTQAKLVAVAGIHGRAVQFTRADDAGTLESPSLSQRYDVVLLHDASSSDPAGLGGRWAATLGTFVAKGGVVVALDGAASRMPSLLTSAGLLAVSGHTVLADNTHLVVSGPADVVGAQVLSPYATIGAPISFQGVAAPGPELTWVVRAEAPPASGDPVVVHRVVR